MQKYSSQSGFTLVELLVSLALFTVVVVAAVGSLYTINQASNNVSSLRAVLDNLNFATESMSRTIRTGTNIICGGTDNQQPSANCPFGNNNGPADEISFVSTLPGAAGGIEYKRVATPNVVNSFEIERCDVVSNSPSNCLAITSPEINIQQLHFYVDGADTGDGKQPSVVIIMQGIANSGKDSQTFAIQTYVSQRAAE
jgi:prepilin-type N-terminal cleavage/methylation domain-containing protein